MGFAPFADPKKIPFVALFIAFPLTDEIENEKSFRETRLLHVGYTVRMIVRVRFDLRACLLFFWPTTNQ